VGSTDFPGVEVPGAGGGCRVSQTVVFWALIVMVGILWDSLDTALPPKSAAAAAAAAGGGGGGGRDGSGGGGAQLPPQGGAEGAAAHRGGSGAVPEAVREAVVQRARRGQAEYVEEEADDFQGQPFRKCKPLLKLVGVDNPQVGGGGGLATAECSHSAQTLTAP
jgi:hypothetical protein